MSGSPFQIQSITVPLIGAKGIGKTSGHTEVSAPPYPEFQRPISSIL